MDFNTLIDQEKFDTFLKNNIELLKSHFSSLQNFFRSADLNADEKIDVISEAVQHADLNVPDIDIPAEGLVESIFEAIGDAIGNISS